MKNIDIRLVLITTSVLIFVFIISILAAYLIITQGNRSNTINNANVPLSSNDANLSTNESETEDISKSNQEDENNESENGENNSNQESRDPISTSTPTSKPSPTKSNINNDIKRLETPVLSLTYSEKKFSVLKNKIAQCGDSSCYYIQLVSNSGNYDIYMAMSLDEKSTPGPSGFGFCDRSVYDKQIDILGQKRDLVICKNEEGYINLLLVGMIDVSQKNKLYVQISVSEQNKMTSLTSEMFNDINTVLSSIKL